MKFIQLKDITSDEKYSIVDGPFGSSMKTSDYVIEGIPVLQGKNITGNKFNFADIRFISEKKAYELSRSKVIVGDYLLVKIGSIGYLARIDTLGEYEYAIIPANLAKIKIDEKKIHPGYFEQVFKQEFIKRKLINLSSKTAQPALSLGKIRSFEIPIPEQFEDQFHIANILGCAENLITQRKKSILLLDEFLKSTFFEMFGDPVKNEKRFKITELGKLGSWKSGGTPSRAKKEYFNGNVYWLTSGELNEMFISDSKEKISNDAISNSNAKEIPIYSLLLGMYDTAALKSSINLKIVTCNQAIAYAKLDDTLCNTVYVYFSIQIGKEYFRSQQRGVRQKNMNLSMIKGLKISLPPLGLQTQFANIVEKTEVLKAQYQFSLQELENLYSSLSQRAFKGELNAKDEEMLMAAEPIVKYTSIQ